MGQTRRREGKRKGGLAMAIKIDIDRISSVKVDVSSVNTIDTGANIHSEPTILDDSAAPLNSAMHKIWECSTELVTAAENMENYLNDIAQTFEERDIQLSRNISANNMTVNHSGPNPYADKI